MSSRPIDPDSPPAQLQEKFGAEADLYAEVRAEAAAAAGRLDAARKWERTAKQLEESEARDEQ